METNTCMLQRLTAQGVVQTHRLYHGPQGERYRQVVKVTQQKDECGATKMN